MHATVSKVASSPGSASVKAEMIIGVSPVPRAELPVSKHTRLHCLLILPSSHHCLELGAKGAAVFAAVSQLPASAGKRGLDTGMFVVSFNF